MCLHLVPHQSDLDKPDSAAMGVALVYHNLGDGVLSTFTEVLYIAVALFRLENHAGAYQNLCVCT
jgi:hypothetical protein